MPHRGLRVVVVTPAGRRRYLELLVPHVARLAAAGLVDEHRLWVNTDDAEDIAYMESLESDLLRLERLPAGAPLRGNLSIHHFFRGCVDAGAVYVRFDDDVVFVDDADAFRAFLDFRIDNPDFFVVYATILNNAVVTHLQQRVGNLDASRGAAAFSCMDRVGWRDPHFAAHLHERVLDELERAGSLARFRLPFAWRLLANERVSINCVSWLGARFGAVCPDGRVGEDEEHEIAVAIPRRAKLANCIYGGFCVVHYAFYPQRGLLDARPYLARYAATATRSSTVGSGTADAAGA